MRTRWRLLAGVILVGALLGIAIGGVPTGRSDAPLRVAPVTSTTLAVTGGSTSTTLPTAATTTPPK